MAPAVHAPKPKPPKPPPPVHGPHGIPPPNILIGKIPMRNMQHPHSISEESLDTFLTGQTAVGTSAVQLTTVEGQVARKSVKIKALGANTGKVYVGPAGVTTGTGHELAAGAELELKVYDLTTIYVIASAASQAVSWIAV